MNRVVKTGVAVTVFVSVFALTWFFYFPHSPWGKQKANLKRAEELRPMVEQRVRQLAGTDRVKVGVYTGLNGSLSVSGHVANEQIAEVVIREVLATKPPITVQFDLIIGGTDVIQKIVQPDITSNSGKSEATAL